MADNINPNWVVEDKELKSKFDTMSTNNPQFSQKYPSYEQFCDDISPKYHEARTAKPPEPPNTDKPPEGTDGK